MGRGFVGREAELSELAGALDDAVEGQGEAFLVLGEPGIGKTRLASELAEHARAAGALVLWGRCWEAGGAPPYWPWVEILRACGAPAALWPAEGDQADRFRLFQRVGAALRDTAAHRPVLVVVDDLHAADVPSLLLTEYLLSGPLRQSRVALVALARDRELAGAEAIRLRRLARQVRLGGLGRDDVARLVALATDVEPSPEVVDSIVERTEGNPLFVEELAALLVAGDDLRPLPAGVRETIRQRLAPLPRDAVDTLTRGAVAGREFDLEVIGAAHDALDSAAQLGVVTQVRPGRHRFAHILVRDVLYDGLAPGERTAIHGQVAAAIERRHQADLDEHLDELAHHYVEAGDVERARAYLVRAGQRADALLAHERAVARFEHALDLTAPASADRVEVLLLLGRAYDRTGRTDDARESFRRARQIATALGDGIRVGAAALGLAAHVAFQQRDDSVVETLEAALAGLPGESPDAPAMRARLLSSLARVLGYVGRRDAIEDTARAAVLAARELGDPEVLVEALAAWQFTLWGPDRVGERAAVANEVLALADRRGDRCAALEAHLSLMICHLELGDLREFDRSLAAYVRLAEELRQPHYRFVALTRQAMRALMQGDLEAGAALAEDARRLGNECGEPDAEPVYHGLWALPARHVGGDRLAEVERFFLDFSTRHTSAGSRALLAVFAIDRGDEAAARRDLHALMADIVDRPKDMDWLLCLALAGEVAAALGESEPADLLYATLAPYEDRCALVAGAVGFAGSIAHYLGLLATSLGRTEDARRHFEVAERAHLDMGATPWVARTARARGVGSSMAGTVTLRPAGATWLIRRDRTEFHVPDGKGLRYLARLLARPSTEHHVLDLVGAVAGVGDAGPVLDAEAKRAYRRRLEDLRDDLVEAEAWNDTERAGRAQVEIDALARELQASLGLGGRDRAASPMDADRARVSVRKAIVRSLAEITKHDADLGRYLTTTIRTGVYCSYDPDPRFAISWDVSPAAQGST